MKYLIGALGLAQMGASFLYLNVATSAVHEAVVATLFGAGSITLALSFVIATLDRRATTPTPAATPTDNIVTTYKHYLIRRSVLGVSTAGQSFDTVDAAKAFIDLRVQDKA